jgi:inner membrane protein
MDSLTQILLGASVAALAVPKAHRRRAIAVGAALGTFPDLDVIPLALMDVDPVTYMTVHRGMTHSFAFLSLFALALWWGLRRVWAPVREAPRAWLWGIGLALLTHPLLDAHTVYGTQLWWPLPVSPVMWSTLFIIDPLYTLPLLAGVLAVLAGGAREWARAALLGGVVLSTAYVGWSLVAKQMVERAASRSLAEVGLQDAPRFSVPMPFNTVLWRVVVMTPEGYLEGERSLVADRGSMVFRAHDSDVEALAAVRGLPAVERLDWFNRGFMRAAVLDDQLVLSDLRMGVDPNYTFNFAVAQQSPDGWQEIVPEQIRWERREVGGLLAAMWRRIWERPAGELALAERGVVVDPGG